MRGPKSAELRDSIIAYRAKVVLVGKNCVSVQRVTFTQRFCLCVRPSLARQVISVQRQRVANAGVKWFCTDDIARQDSAGFVYICGRKKEIIISGGLNIHPTEVNEVLVKHTMVAEVATVGFPDRDWGEIVVSAVVCKPNTNPSEIDLINHCRESLEEKKVPKRIVFLDSLPRGDAGKVQIHQLQKLIQPEDLKVEGKLTLESFFTIAAKVFQLNSTELSLKDRSGRIPGWDSLAHLNLILSIEKATGVSFSVQEIVSIDSLEDIWTIINRKK